VLIIGIVSAIALPTVLPAISHRQLGEASRIVQGALVGARDAAIHRRGPSGIRLLPDPTFLDPVTRQPNPNLIMAANRIIPIEPAPDYTEGRLTTDPAYPAGQFLGTANGVKPLAYWWQGPTGWRSTGNYPTSVLVVEETVLDADGSPNPPVSWWWNIRLGDQLQVNNAGPWYTVVGPMAIGPAGGNSELFVNVGPPGQVFKAGANSGPSPLVRPVNGKVTFPEFLFLVNGRDDNGNGWVDEGWDGVDNNGNGSIDEPGEWIETETWVSGAVTR
jgi:hypothetical protein